MKNRITINHCCVDSGFYELVNDTLIPASVDTNSFWAKLTDILTPVATLTASAPTDAEHKGISLLNPRYALKVLNNRWGSLYSALYQEDAIPHTAGLKTGGKYNVARGTRVTNYAKEILDSAFPLTEGSHKDAISYLVYFENLMLVLADGSTVGLQKPAHFVAKSGPKSDPESIILNNRDLHVEICFNRRGANGSLDIASIDNIRIEAPAETAISLQANSISEKCQIYTNLRALIRGELKANFDRHGKRHTRCLQHSNTVTAKGGSTYHLRGCNPMVLQPQASDTLNIICDKSNRAVPSALIDLIVTCLIQAGTKRCLAVSLQSPSGELSTHCKTVLQQLSAIPGMPAITLNLVTDTTAQPQSYTVCASAAEGTAEQIPYFGTAKEQPDIPETRAIQNGAVLKAIDHFSA